MKKLNQLRTATKIFVTAVLLLAAQQALMSQIIPAPISGNLYGQPIVASNYLNGYRYVATGSSVYASSGAQSSYYFRVFSAPMGYTIVNSFVAHYYWGDGRTVLLRNTSGNYYFCSNRINVPSVDDNISNLISLPGFFVPFTKIAVQGNNVYALIHEVICGTQGTLYVSYNQGQTWEQDTVGVGYSVVFDFTLDSSGNLYTVSSSGVYREWAGDTTTATQLNITGNVPSNIFIDRLGRIIVSATSFSYSPTDLAYYSTDGGMTFTTDPALNGSFNFFADDAFGNLFALGTDSNENSTLACMNAAGNWSTVNSNFSTAIGESQINCFSGDSLLVLGTSSGVFTSANQGTTFTTTNQGILAEDIYSIIQQPFGRLFCTTDLGVFYKDLVDSVWHQTYSIPGINAGMLLFNDPQGNIFVQQSVPMNAYEIPSPMAKSIDNGISWTQDGAGLNNISGLSFYIDETGAQHFYSTEQFNSNALNIWTRQMGDTTWNIDNAGLFGDPELGYGVNVVYGDGQGYLYTDLYTNWGNYMYRRPVRGSEWVCDSVGLSLGQRVISMASSPEFGIIAAIGGLTFGSYSTLYHRTENGWVQIPTRNDSTNISAVSVDANGVIFVTEPAIGLADNSATYYTSDGGVTWSAANLAGMNIQGSSAFEGGTPAQGGLVSVGNITYALTQGNWGFAFASTKGATGIKVTAINLSNLQVFPNPSEDGLWNLKTTDEMVDGQMQVTDMNGRVVYRGTLNAAKATISLPGLASGYYVLNITNAGKSVSNLLVKQ